MENNKINSFMSPKLSMAFVVLVVASLITSILAFMNSGAQGAEVGLGILFAVLIFSLILSSFALYLSTRLVKVPQGSFARAMTFSSGATLILSILASLLILVGLPIALVFLIDIIILIALVRWYYKVSVMRSFGVFLINCVISGIIAFICFIIMAAFGFGLITAFLFNAQKGIEKDMGNWEVPTTQDAYLDENLQDNGTVSGETILNQNSLQESSVVTSKNSGTTLSDGKIAYIKKMFPSGFPLPADSQIKFTESKDFPGQYDLDYTIPGNFKMLATSYESIFKKAGYKNVVTDFNADLDGVLNAEDEKTGRILKFWFYSSKPFAPEKPETVRVNISTFIW